ncbi:MAG: sigma-54 dependent transcriptional regulator [Desulfobulbaceae bacterium]|nr:sigma-54 dependent transcriptional regulator [Desulfobulbaceae bacterium]
MNRSGQSEKKDKIIVVDDDLYLLAAIRQTLTMNGYIVDTFNEPARALTAIPGGEYVAVIADIKMPGMDGLQLLGCIREMDRELPVIMITGHGDVAMAVTAIRNGAYDFLEKPVDEDVLMASLIRAVEKRQLIIENRRLNSCLYEQRHKRNRFYGLVGNHPAMHHLYDVIETVSREGDTVLLCGETGTGKELVARAIHEIADRAGKPFVAVNMAAIPVEMIESELFGHVKGAFTGAVERKIGKFEYAEEGSIFLDEICSLPITLQAKLLRVLEDRIITPLGTNVPTPVKARVIAATNKDLKKEMRQQTFRQDLYFRLNVLPIEIPPLRDRKTDIPLLAEFFRQEYCHERQQDVEPFGNDMIKDMMRNDWPGNVRELKNYVRRLCIFGSGTAAGKITESQELFSDPEISPQLKLKDFLEQVEKKYIVDILLKNRGQISPTHQELEISRKSLYDKVKKYDLDLHSFRKDK